MLIDQFETRQQPTPRQFILNTVNKFLNAGLHGFTAENGSFVSITYDEAFRWFIMGIFPFSRA